MVMPSGSSPQLDDQGETSPCLFWGPKTFDVFRSTPNFPSPAIQPTQPQHSIRPTKDKGLGLFVTRDLNPTDLILAERPLLVILSRIQGIFEQHLSVFP